MLKYPQPIMGNTTEQKARTMASNKSIKRKKKRKKRLKRDFCALCCSSYFQKVTVSEPCLFSILFIIVNVNDMVEMQLL